MERKQPRHPPGTIGPGGQPIGGKWKTSASADQKALTTPLHIKTINSPKPKNNRNRKPKRQRQDDGFVQLLKDANGIKSGKALLGGEKVFLPELEEQVQEGLHALWDQEQKKLHHSTQKTIIADVSYSAFDAAKVANQMIEDRLSGKCTCLPNGRNYEDWEEHNLCGTCDVKEASFFGTARASFVHRTQNSDEKRYMGQNPRYAPVLSTAADLYAQHARNVFFGLANRAETDRPWTVRDWLQKQGYYREYCEWQKTSAG